jgi:hypothetical protein
VLPRENACRYGSFASGQILYDYVGGNAMNFQDTTGLDPIIGVIVGGGFGAISGGWGAWHSGGNFDQIVGGAAGGFAAGILIGFVDPSFGIATVMVVGAAAGGAGDIWGQILGNNFDLQKVNQGEALGAAVGAAAGAGMGARVAIDTGLALEGLCSGSTADWIGNILGGIGGFVPSTFGGEIGKDLISPEPEPDWPHQLKPQPEHH